MADFLTDDIDTLLNANEAPKLSEDEKALEAMQKADNMLLTTFRNKSRDLRWPEPVRKRFLR